LGGYHFMCWPKLQGNTRCGKWRGIPHPRRSVWNDDLHHGGWRTEETRKGSLSQTQRATREECKWRQLFQHSLRCSAWSKMTQGRDVANKYNCLSTARANFAFQSSCAYKTPYLKVVGILIKIWDLAPSVDLSHLCIIAQKLELHQEKHS
jgi:hypothetical protein